VESFRVRVNEARQAECGVEIQESRSGGFADLRIPEGTPTVKLVKRIVIGLVVAFLLFFLITRPQDAANAVQGVFDAVSGAIVAVFDFFSALAS
jgi:hypothetical protein